MAIRLSTFQLSQVWVLLLMAMFASATVGQTGVVPADEALTDDLRTVIVLAGYQCNNVVEHSRPNQSDYHVSCDMDRHYLVSVSEEKGLVISDRSSAPQDISQKGTDHEEFMKRQLFAILNLSGHMCAEVLSFERKGPKDNIVTCHDQTVFRIHVTPEGRLTVDPQPVEK